MSLCDADRHFATQGFFTAITFETFQKFVELVLLFVKRRQLLHEVCFVVDLFRFLERAPIDFDRFVSSELLSQRLAQ